MKKKDKRPSMKQDWHPDHNMPAPANNGDVMPGTPSQSYQMGDGSPDSMAEQAMQP